MFFPLAEWTESGGEKTFVHTPAQFFQGMAVGLVVAAGVAGWIAVQTEKGRNFVNLCLEARVEIRKVVWPTRQETTQTTIVVLIVIMIVAIILFGLDGLLNWIISGFIT